MRYLIQIRFTLILQTVTAFVFTNKNGVLIKYNIDLKRKCQAVDQRFAFIHGLSIAQCVEECGLRTHCASLNFWRRVGACALFSSAVEGTVKNGNCVHVLREDIDVKEKPCSECVNGEVCDTKSRACRLKDCSQVTVPDNGKILGNVNKIGSWIQYKCNAGYITQNGNQRAVCNADGRWNETNCVQAEMTTAIGCVTIENYVGTLSTTSNGTICQRWDTQWPHTHSYNSPEIFPDTSVAAAANYCRALGWNELWCYTTDPDTRWDSCENPTEVCEDTLGSDIDD